MRPFLVFFPVFLSLAGTVSTTAAAAESKITKGPWIQQVTATSAIVRVEVDPPATVTVEVGEAGPARAAIVTKEPRSVHAVPLENLEPATRYGYDVRVGKSVQRGAFLTAPRPDAKAPFRFLVYGDNRTDDAAHAAVVRAMAAAAGDFVVHTGDFVEDGGQPQMWQSFFDIESPLLRDRCIFSCVGNHELTDGAGIAYVKYFAPVTPQVAEHGMRPEHLNGSFRWGNTRFFFMNGMVQYQSGVDRAWLDNELAKADREADLQWRVVVIHHGPWSSGPHGENALLHHAGVVDALRAHQVDLVVSGHDHIYERGQVGPMAYIVSGGGGAPPYRVKNRRPYASVVESVRHFVEVEASATTMSVQALRPDRSTVDKCTLRKGMGWDCGDPPPVVTAATPSSTSTSGSAPTGKPDAPSARCGCRLAGEPAGEGGRLAMAVAAGVLGTILALRRRVRRLAR